MSQIDQDKNMLTSPINHDNLKRSNKEAIGRKTEEFTRQLNEASSGFAIEERNTMKAKDQSYEKTEEYMS